MSGVKSTGDQRKNRWRKESVRRIMFGAVGGLKERDVRYRCGRSK